MGLTISAVVFVLCLIAVEVVLGFILPDWGTFRYQADDEIGFRLEPSEKASVNDAGFRDYEYSRQKPSNVFRVVGIGDSQTASCGFTPIENAYLKVFESTLNVNGSSSAKYEVLNLGVPNYAPHQYLAMLKKFGLPYDPDAVVVAVYIGNDIAPAQGNTDYLVFDGKLISRRALNLLDKSEFEIRVWKWLHERKIYRVLQRAQYAKIWSAYDQRPRHEFNRLSVFKKENVWTPQDRQRMTDAWANVEDSLVQIRDVVRNDGARLLVVLIPDEHQINPVLRDQTLTDMQYRADDYDFDQWNRKLAALCDDNGIPLLDLAPGLSEAIQQERLYFKNDIHLNVRGHQLMGKLIYDYFATHEFLPSEA